MTATYNGVSMTRIGNILSDGAADKHAIFYLINPATGAHTVQLTQSAGSSLLGASASYTGVAQSASAIVSNAEVVSHAAGNITISTTTVPDKSWLICWASNYDGGISYVSGGIERETYGGLMTLDDSNGSKPPGTYSFVVNQPAGSFETRNGTFLVSFAPSAHTHIQVRNTTTGNDMLSTNLSIDDGNTDSATSLTPAVINASFKNVTKNDLLAIDVDEVSPNVAPKGLYVTLRFKKP